MTSLWTQEYLASKRLVGDPPADELIHALYATPEEVDKINQSFKQLEHNCEFPPNLFPEDVLNFLKTEACLPKWQDPDKIILTEKVFNVYGPQCLLSLFGCSLPRCYGMANGVNALTISQGLTTHVNRRLLQTTQFLLDVMNIGGLGKRGHGVISAQRVRLFHTSMRYLIPRDAQWDEATWGIVICQEDMALTSLTFSLGMIDGVEALGVSLSDEEKEAMVHTWNCISAVMGVEAELLPANLEQARELFAAISEHQYKESDAGKLLTESMIGFMEEIVPGNIFDGFPGVLIRHMSGDELANMLGVPRTSFFDLGKVLYNLTKRASTKKDEYVDSHEQRMAIIALFYQKLLNGLQHAVLDGQTVNFAMAPSLEEEWVVN